MSDNPGMDVEELVEETNERYEEQQEAQEAFLETVAEEEGTETLETTVNLVGDYTAPVSAKLDGRLMDKLSHIDERLESIESGESRIYELSEVADDAAQLLADLIDDTEYNKETFYKVYEQEGLDVLGQFIETVFEGLENARERNRGAADGFRKE